MGILEQLYHYPVSKENYHKKIGMLEQIYHYPVSKENYCEKKECWKMFITNQTTVSKFGEEFSVAGKEKLQACHGEIYHHDTEPEIVARSL